jgi:3-hydroxy-3-methylglutaryl CoA synthase
MFGILGYGGYIPRLRLSRRAVVDANAWYAPHLLGKGKGTRSMGNFDEDSLTMAVAAARDCLGPTEDRSAVRALHLASNTLPFAERLNAAIVAEVLTLDGEIATQDSGGSSRAALVAIEQAIDAARAGRGAQLVIATDQRAARAGSSQELDQGDGAAAVLLGEGDAVLAEHLGGAVRSADFVDHFREAGETIDYHWEERWVRDEGISKLLPPVVAQALAQAGVAPAEVSHFIFPSSFAKLDRQIAKACGLRAESVVDNLAETVGDTGVAHPLLLLAAVLERATPGQLILVAQFGSGAQACVFRVTDSITKFRPAKGVATWLERGVEERNYTKFLSFQGQLELERGMRGEQDRKTALSTAWRHRAALLGLVAGRCEVSGQVQFPPSRLSVEPGHPRLDTQRPHKLAERRARVLSWSAEFLSYHRSPPHTYGQVDFEGGGRILMEFTDIDKGDIDTGTDVEMVFRIKDHDDRRGYTRYFWKATPVRNPSAGKD